MCCAFEMYYQHLINKIKKLTKPFDWKDNEKWNLFLNLLNKEGYFSLDIPNGSEEYRFLIKQAKIMFLNVYKLFI